jgi:hypothetical protein
VVCPAKSRNAASMGVIINSADKIIVAARIKLIVKSEKIESFMFNSYAINCLVTLKMPYDNHFIIFSPVIL